MIARSVVDISWYTHVMCVGYLWLVVCCGVTKTKTCRPQEAIILYEQFVFSLACMFYTLAAVKTLAHLYKEHRLRCWYRHWLDKRKLHCVKSEACCICLEDMEHSVVIRMPCQHMFHKECLKQWFAHRLTCPLCRSTSFIDAHLLVHRVD